ncbi:MAG: dTMP kinase [Thermoanaerobaculia bacterium]|nr:dTMP kinase [Thermoanaerobaculia bacterium]
MTAASSSRAAGRNDAPTRREGVFLVIEGIDGVGKTTQVSRLAEELRGAGEPVTTSKEPTDGPWGRALRRSFEEGRLSLVGELLHVIKDRRQHVEELIAPALAAGDVVILDRYFYSTVAYQGARLADPGEGSLARLAALASRGLPLPRMVFLLDIPAEEGIRRISEGRGDRPNLLERVEALDRARRTFAWLARREPGRFWVLDGLAPPERIHRTVLHLTLDVALWEELCGRPHGCETPSACPRRADDGCRWHRLKRALAPDDDGDDLSALVSPSPPRRPGRSATGD